MIVIVSVVGTALLLRDGVNVLDCGGLMFVTTTEDDDVPIGETSEDERAGVVPGNVDERKLL